MAPEMREEAVSLRLSRDERQMLKGLSAATGLTQSDVLRQALREKWAKHQAEAPSKKKR